MVDDLAQPEHADDDEPHHHHRAEHPRDPRRAAALHEEQARPGSPPTTGMTQSLERGRRDLEALDGAEHRDRRRDQAVAVEQGRAEHAERDDRPPACPVGSPLRGITQRGEGEDAALAVVVGAHHEQQVLDRDDDDQRPEHDRRDAVGVGLGRPSRSACSNDSRNAYSGLVPMSPYTMPRAPNASAGSPGVACRSSLVTGPARYRPRRVFQDDAGLGPTVPVVRWAEPASAAP